MAKYIDDKGLKRFAGNIDDQINNARYSILKTKGKADGIASLDSKGFVPLSQLGNLDMTFFEVVAELPTSGIKKHIYLIKNEKEGEQDTYDEYIYTGDVEGEYDESKWEKLGDFVPTFDLKEYTKKEDAVKSIKVDAIQTMYDAPENCELGLWYYNGEDTLKCITIPVVHVGGYSFTPTGKPAIDLGYNGLMSVDDKAKLDEIDTTALSQSISNANTAADNTNAAISACKTATEGAEKVNAELTDENVINITDRNGTVKSTDLSGAVKAADDISRIKKTLGSYSDRDDIVLSPTKTNKAISADGVEVNKTGWNIAEFTAELGNEYLFKPGVIDSNVCIFAEYVDKKEARAIDYQYTYTEDGKIATATATYNGKTYTYTYDYSGSDTVITDQSGSKITSLPTVYTTTIGSYNVLTRLNADAELPEDGYCRFVSNFQVASSIKVVVSYKADSADLNMKVVHDGMTASMCTQLSKINKKVDDVTAKIPKMWLEIGTNKDIDVSISGKKVHLEAYKIYKFNDITSINLSSSDLTNAKYVTTFQFHYNDFAPIYGIKLGGIHFFGLSNIPEPVDFSMLDTHNVTSLNSAFIFYKKSYINISHWDVSNVTDMYAMLWTSSVPTVDLRNWDTRKVKDINGCFWGIYNGTEYVSIQELHCEGWDLRSCTNFGEPFGNMGQLKSFYLGEGWGRVPNSVTTMKFDIPYWTYGVTTLLELYDRKANGMNDVNLQLPSKTKDKLGDEGIATLTERGYTVSFF